MAAAGARLRIHAATKISRRRRNGSRLYLRIARLRWLSRVFAQHAGRRGYPSPVPAPDVRGAGEHVAFTLKCMPQQRCPGSSGDACFWCGEAQPHQIARCLQAYDPTPAKGMPYRSASRPRSLADAVARPRPVAQSAPCRSACHPCRPLQRYTPATHYDRPRAGCAQAAQA